MKKLAFVCSALLLTMLCLSGCGSRLLSEKELAELLPGSLTSYLDGDENLYVQNVDDIKVIKQDAEQDTQFVECEITLSDEHFKRVIYADIELRKYDIGGWQVDYWDSYREEEITILSGPDASLVRQRLANCGYSEDALTLVSEEINGDAYYAYFDVNDVHTYVTFGGTIQYTAYLFSHPAYNTEMGYIGWDSNLDLDNVTETWTIEGSWIQRELDKELPRYFTLNIESIDSDGNIICDGQYSYPMWDWDADELSDEYDDAALIRINVQNYESPTPRLAELKVSVDYCDALGGVFYFTAEEARSQSDDYSLEKR